MAGLQIEFTVHNVTSVPHSVPALVKGEQIMASVDCLEVELTTGEDNPHGSFTARFIGAEAALARAKFTKGSKHKWAI